MRRLMALALCGLAFASPLEAQAANFPVEVDMSVCLALYYYLPVACPLGSGTSGQGELLGTTGVDTGTFTDLALGLPGTWTVDRAAGTLVLDYVYYLPMRAEGAYIGGGCFEGEVTLYGFIPVGLFTMCKAP